MPIFLLFQGDLAEDDAKHRVSCRKRQATINAQRCFSQAPVEWAVPQACGAPPRPKAGRAPRVAIGCVIGRKPVEGNPLRERENPSRPGSFAGLFHLWIRVRFAARRTFGRSLATRNGGMGRIDHHRLSRTGRGRSRRGPPHAARFAASPAKPGGPPFHAASAWLPRFAVTLAGGAGRCRPAGSALAGGVGAKAPTSS